MKTYLQVPFDKRHRAKDLGARWDLARCAWFVPDGIDLTPFLEWVPGLPKITRKVVRVLGSRT